METEDTEEEAGAEVSAVHVDGRVSISVVTEDGEADAWLDLAQVERYLKEVAAACDEAREYGGVLGRLRTVVEHVGSCARDGDCPLCTMVPADGDGAVGDGFAHEDWCPMAQLHPGDIEEMK